MMSRTSLVCLLVVAQPEQLISQVNSLSQERMKCAGIWSLIYEVLSCFRNPLVGVIVFNCVTILETAVLQSHVFHHAILYSIKHNNILELVTSVVVAINNLIIKRDSYMYRR